MKNQKVLKFTKCYETARITPEREEIKLTGEHKINLKLQYFWKGVKTIW